MKLILASTSRYRKELLDRLNLAFDSVAPEVDETLLANEPPTDTARRLALAKARAVAGRYPDALIVGSDQVAICEGRRLDKPGNHANAVGQLRHASGRSVVFHTAVVLLNAHSGRVQSELVPTETRFRKLSDADIERYLQAEPAYDCAGSAKSEGLGISLLEKIQSPDPTALVGLPLIALCSMLRNEGFQFHNNTINILLKVKYDYRSAVFDPHGPGQWDGGCVGWQTTPGGGTGLAALRGRAPQNRPPVPQIPRPAVAGITVGRA